MNKRYLLLLLPVIILTSCSEDDPEFEYDFRIARTIYRNDSWSDSSVFYYDKAMRLVREDRCYGVDACDRQTVYYDENSITNSSVIYQLDNDQRIISRENGEVLTSYFYDNDLISRYEIDSDGEKKEKYFFYEQRDLIRDSTTILLSGQSSDKITVYQHEYTNLARPEFMIHHSGLFEFPQESANLPASSTATALGIRKEFEYEFVENTFIQHAISLDTFNDQIFFRTTTIYYLLDDME